MKMDERPIPREHAGHDTPAIAEIIERLSRFSGPPEQFLLNLLAVQCRLTGAQGGAILRNGQDGQAAVIAVFPPLGQNETAPVWLAQSVESTAEVLSEAKTAIKPLHSLEALYGEPAGSHVVMIPLRGGDSVRGVAAYHVKAPATALCAITERLELTVSLLNFYEMRLTLQQRDFDLRRLRTAMETLSSVNEPERFAGAAMAFCNEVATRWQCERVSLGFLKGRYVQLRAMSHTEKVSRKMKLVQDIEAAMEECLDQDVEILHPGPPDATYVSRAAGDLSKHHGPMNIISLPLRRGGEPVAVLTAERISTVPFALESIEALRLACDLCTARLANLHEHDRWIGAKAAAGVRKGLAGVVGPKHTWAKLTAVLVAAGLLFIIIARTDYTADARFTLQAVEQQVIPAPFDGYIKSVNVVPGDFVFDGSPVLAELETAELRLQLKVDEADQQKFLKQAAAALRDGKTGEMQIAQADADKAAAHMALLNHRIEQARIVSHLKGCVIKGDLKKEIGAPVKTGDVLFEIAPIESLRAELLVPEDQIADVKVGQKGELSTASYPARRIEFVVEQINPVAELVNQQNVFKVRVRLQSAYPWMRPGMEGEARVVIDRRSYASVWTRRLVNWLRMKLWI